MIDFEPFAPIDALRKKHRSPLEEKEEEIRQLRKEIEELKKQNRELRKTVESIKFALGSQIRRLEEEKKHLLEQLGNLKAENEQLKEELTEAKKQLEEFQKERESFLKLTEQLREKINQNLESLKHEMLNLWEKVTLETLKELLNTDKFQNEETLKRLFTEIFADKLFLGELEVKANPEDVSLLKDILENKEGIIYNIKADPSLRRGELEIETDKFFIERRYNELIPQIIRETIEKLFQNKEEEND